MADLLYLLLALAAIFVPLGAVAAFVTGAFDRRKKPTQPAATPSPHRYHEHPFADSGYFTRPPHGDS